MLICLDMRTSVGCGTQTVDETRFCVHCGQNLRFALLLRDAGTLVERYRVVRTIGYGGFGAVYEALDESGERVALKETFDTRCINTLEREFIVLSRLSHANLPRYIDMFEAQGNGYLVMEYVPGQSLQDILDTQTGLLPESQVLGYALQLCDVLDYLHSQLLPIFHRDIKPANIRLTPEGGIKLVDVGLFKQGKQSTRAKIRGLGTLGYASIEQYAEDQPVNKRHSDVYALAATLYHLLSGKEPPSALNRLAHPDKNKEEALPPLPAGLSPHLKEAIIKGMSVMPDDRFANMQTFKQALQSAKASNESAHHKKPQIIEVALTPSPSPNTRRGEPKKRETKPLNKKEQTSSQSGTPLKKPNNVKRLWNYVKAKDKHNLPHLICHDSPAAVLTISYYADGKELLGVSSIGTLYFWYVADGRLINKQVLRAGQKRLTCAAISPDGRTIAIGDERSIVCVCNTADGRLLYQLRGHTDIIMALTYTPDSQVLVSSDSNENTVRFWNLADGKQLRTLRAKERITSLQFSPNGQYLACGSYSHTYIWDTNNEMWRMTIGKGATSTENMRWSPDGQLLLCGSGSKDNDAQVWHIVNGQEIISLGGHTEFVNAVAWGPNGHLAFTAGDDSTIRVWSPIAPHLQHVAGGSQISSIHCLAVSPNGRTFASGGRYGSVRIWFLKHQGKKKKKKKKKRRKKVKS